MRWDKMTPLDKFKAMSSIKIYKSLPKCNGKTKYGVRSGGGTWNKIWAINEAAAWDIALI